MMTYTYRFLIPPELNMNGSSIVSPKCTVPEQIAFGQFDCPVVYLLLKDPYGRSYSYSLNLH